MSQHHKPRVLVVGSFVMDLIVTTPRFPREGETVLGTDFNQAPGGKGANQAVQMARLGLDVTMVGAVGRDMFGDALLSAAQEAGINVDHVQRRDDAPSAIGNVQLELSPDGQTKNRIIVVSGANMEIKVEDVQWLQDDIMNYDMVVLQQEIPAEINLAVARMAREHNIPVLLNPAPARTIDPELLRSLTIIAPNEHEARAVVSSVDAIELSSDPTQELTNDEMTRIAAWLRSEGIGTLLVTLGERGAMYIDETTQVHSPCIKLQEAADPTAAGDSFIGAYVTASTRQLGHEDALIFANHCAALTVSRLGAMTSLPHLPELIRFLEERQAPQTLIHTVKGW